MTQDHQDIFYNRTPADQFRAALDDDETSPDIVVIMSNDHKVLVLKQYSDVVLMDKAVLKRLIPFLEQHLESMVEMEDKK